MYPIRQWVRYMHPLKSKPTWVVISEFKRLIQGIYITEYGVYPLVYYQASFNQVINMVSGQVVVLNLEFPGVPSSLLKIGRLRVAVDVNQYKKYAFTFYQIPFKPDTDTIDWN